MDWRDKAVLVTGGAGFIGSNLVSRLLELGASVRVADSLSRGNIENLSSVTDRIKFMQVDLTDGENCMEACEGVEYVFHLAASVGGIHYIKKENVEGSTPSLLMNTHMLEAARRCDVERFLFASSACVYREKSMTLNRFTEEDAYPADPLTTYGWTKLMGEIQCKSYFLDYGLKTSAPRIFNAFGEHESIDLRSAHVIPSLIRKALLYPRDGFTLFGDGKQERAFLYVKDCIEGLIRCVEAVEDGSAINLGAEEVVSIAKVAEQIIALSGKKIKIQFDLSGPQGTHRYCADTTKMRQVLTWSPQIPFLEGLKNTFNWMGTRLRVVA